MHNAIDRPPANVGHNRVNRGQVAVNVGDDRQSHRFRLTDEITRPFPPGVPGESIGGKLGVPLDLQSASQSVASARPPPFHQSEPRAVVSAPQSMQLQEQLVRFDRWCQWEGSYGSAGIWVSIWTGQLWRFTSV